MEIQLLEKGSIKIRGKNDSLGINPTKDNQYNAIVLIGKQATTKSAGTGNDGVVIINGPGEYEIIGIKISGIRNKSETVYSLSVDGVDVLIGTISALIDAQQKIKEHNIAIIATDSDLDASFVTNIASNIVMFYGDEADKVIHRLAKENIKTLSRYQTTSDKLPSEMETVLLQ